MTREGETLGGRWFRLFRVWALWHRQGRPNHMPVILTRGAITKCRHGYALVTDWAWSGRYMTAGPIDAEHMVDILGAQYGVTRVPFLDCCPACSAVVTS